MSGERARERGPLSGDELDACQSQLDLLQQDLSGFEQRYAVPSDPFYKEYQAGERGDAMDFVEWASLIQMADRLRMRIALLKKQGDG